MRCFWSTSSKLSCQRLWSCKKSQSIVHLINFIFILVKIVGLCVHDKSLFAFRYHLYLLIILLKRIIRVVTFIQNLVAKLRGLGDRDRVQIGHVNDLVFLIDTAVWLNSTKRTSVGMFGKYFNLFSVIFNVFVAFLLMNFSHWRFDNLVSLLHDHIVIELNALGIETSIE